MDHSFTMTAAVVRPGSILLVVLTYVLRRLCRVMMAMEQPPRRRV